MRIWLTPGSPYANDEAAYEAVRWARENNVPFLGTCGGLQYAVVEYFRNVLGVSDASHAESDGVGSINVIRQLACSLQGQERLVRPVPGTRFARLMDDEALTGMHYCRYGPGPDELRRLTEGGMVIEATADDAEAEVIELPAKRFFMLTLFQPQIGALAGKPLHPLLRELVRCARQHAAKPEPLSRFSRERTQRPLWPGEHERAFHAARQSCLVTSEPVFRTALCAGGRARRR